jgi:SAM-dependent methyltransferase
LIREADTQGHGLSLDVGAGSTTLIPSAYQTVRVDLARPPGESDGQFVQASALRLPVRTESFRVVGLFDLIEHIQDDKSLLEEVARVLMPGGIVVATVPAHQWLWSEHDVKARHFRRYGVGDLVAAFERSGFRIEFVHQFYGFLLLPAVIRKVLGRATGMGRPPKPLNQLLLTVARASVRRARLGRSRLGLSIALLARR